MVPEFVRRGESPSSRIRLGTDYGDAISSGSETRPSPASLDGQDVQASGLEGRRQRSYGAIDGNAEVLAKVNRDLPRVGGGLRLWHPLDVGREKAFIRQPLCVPRVLCEVSVEQPADFLGGVYGVIEHRAT